MEKHFTKLCRKSTIQFYTLKSPRCQLSPFQNTDTEKRLLRSLKTGINDRKRESELFQLAPGSVRS